jgi:hypothetical protein
MNPAERDIDLTENDYRFLKGDTSYFRAWGALLGIVYEFCMDNGYGNFGWPTSRGKQAMEEYERFTGMNKEKDERKDVGSG